MKRIFLTAFASVTALWCAAVPARPGMTTYTQPDGTTVSVRIMGDEHHHFFLSEDGYLLAEKEGNFYYADADSEGKVIPSSFRLSEAATRGSGLSEYLSGIDRDAILEKMNTARAASKASSAQAVFSAPSSDVAKKQGPGLFPNSSYPITGSPKSVVLLVEYSDVDFEISNPHEYFTNMLTQPGFSEWNGTGSALDYYTHCSNGQFTPQFDVYGPVKLSQTRSYYGGNNAAGNDRNAARMIIDACRALDDDVDFNQYDTDNDGFIDNVFVFYAGAGEASGGPAESIWPHSSYVTSTVRLDGKYLGQYACTNEWYGNRPDGVGTFLHEFSHVMGLPDLYATSYTGAYTPGEWNIMDQGSYNNNGRTPPAYSSFERYALGWIEPVDMRGVKADVSLEPIENGRVGIYHALDANGNELENEFFLFENRQNENWDKFLPYHGMLVWHVDYSASIWRSNTVNNNPDHQYMDLVEAAIGTVIKTRAYESFPGKKKVKSFTDSSNPNSLSWGGVESGCPITDIAESADGIITFSLNGGGVDMEAPEGLEISDLTDTSFTASWMAKEGQTYYLSVFSINDDDTRSYLEGYENKFVGAVNSHFITGLIPEVKYHIEVAPGNIWQKGESALKAVNGDNSVGNVEDTFGKALCHTVKGEIIVENLPAGAEVAVYDIAGKCIATSKAASEGRVAITIPANGLYIVKTAGAVFKVKA